MKMTLPLRGALPGRAVTVTLLAVFLAGAPILQSDSVGGFGRALAATATCYDDWSTAGPVARAHDLVAVDDALDMARKFAQGRPVKVTLCKSDGGYYYRVAMSDHGGRLSWLRVDAKSGDVEKLAVP